ncbi:MAG: hypothetical protein AAGG75_08790 [Bacteroidota bacterium]
MSNEDRLILDYMAMLGHLSADLKLKLIAKLTDSLREDYEEASPSKKDESWKKLFGAWSDTDENLADFIRSSRLPNRDIPSFD